MTRQAAVEIVISDFKQLPEFKLDSTKLATIDASMDAMQALNAVLDRINRSIYKRLQEIIRVDGSEILTLKQGLISRMIFWNKVIDGKVSPTSFAPVLQDFKTSNLLTGTLLFKIPDFVLDIASWFPEAQQVKKEWDLLKGLGHFLVEIVTKEIPNLETQLKDVVSKLFALTDRAALEKEATAAKLDIKEIEMIFWSNLDKAPALLEAVKIIAGNIGLAVTSIVEAFGEVLAGKGQPKSHPAADLNLEPEDERTRNLENLLKELEHDMELISEMCAANSNYVVASL